VEATFAARETDPSPEDLRLVAALRDGDERAFIDLVERYGASMLRVARTYVSSRAVAEEVVQDAWLGVLRGIDRFEGRSTLKTWIFRILTNTAKTRAQREGRSIPFSSVVDPAADPEEPAVDPDRFLGDGSRWPGHWASAPRRWDDLPEGRLLSRELAGRVARVIDSLPPAQREVIRLRDIEGWSSEEVCSLLEISEANQRVLLHRARSKVRREVEGYVDDAV
jgi:RNA polymerase sigma-70 factor, ECF subfamily